MAEGGVTVRLTHGSAAVLRGGQVLEANQALMAEVLEGLETADLADDEKLIVYAACEGDHELARSLAGAGEPLPPPPPGEATGNSEPAGAYLTAISVEGFRGIGPCARLDLTPGPGLTVVAGRNGSGKSSFAEAAEIALTGRNQRWERLGGDWRRGWRNLHHGGTCAVDVALLIEGVEEPAAVVRSEWRPDADDADEAVVTVQRKGSKKSDYGDLGWREPMESFRPFLSYKELGSLTENPSTMFDKLSAILGLGLLTSALERMRAAIKERSGAEVGEKKLRTELRKLLRASADPRAGQGLELIKSSDPDPDLIMELVAGADPAAAGADESLRALADLPELDRTELAERVRGLREEAAKGFDADAERELELAGLLEQALEFHDDHDSEPCPVCGQGSLDGAWSERTRRSVTELRGRWAQSAEERQRRAAVVLRAEEPRSAMAPLVSIAGADPVLVARVRRLVADLPKAPEALADRLESDLDELAAAIDQVRDYASTELARRQEGWRPVSEAAQSWIPVAREARATAPMLGKLKAGEAWLKATEAVLRHARLLPITDEAARIWSELRQESNVELGALELAGATTRRRLKIDVSVDGANAPHAVSVMSQGELNALALSIFLPRATVATSPFRFLIIDDPVQAMDPAKVDGLARVLARVAENRQVIVFTHDDRLPEAVRRLSLPAEVLTVARRTGSVVSVTRTTDPARRHLSDAQALLRDKQVSSAIAVALVPGILRQAVEAACQTRIRKLRLAAGEPYAELEARLAQVPRLISMLAFCCFGDPDKGAAVPGYLKRQSERRGTSDMSHTVRLLNRGAHGELEPSRLTGLMDGTRDLVSFLEEVA